MLMQRPQSRVAQKLAYARWHLDWIDDLAHSDQTGAELTQQHEALLQSSLYHLVSAYRAFLAEIAADIHLLPDASAPDTRSAARLRGAYSEYPPPALMQCVNLEQVEPGSESTMSDAWLALLLGWFERVDSVGDRMSPPSRPSRAQGLIAVGTDNSAQLSRLNLSDCLARLEQLIDRLRDDLQEC